MTTEHQPGSPPVDLDELDRLHAAATQPDWWLGDDGCVYAGSAPNVVDVGETDWGARDEQLAIELRNAYPALSAELRTLRARVGELEAENARLTEERKAFEIQACNDETEEECIQAALGFIVEAREGRARIADLESQLAAARSNGARAGAGSWLVEGLRDVAENATAEERRLVAEHPSWFMPSMRDDARAQARVKELETQLDVAKIASVEVSRLERELSAARSNSAQLSEELRAVGAELARAREERTRLREQISQAQGELSELLSESVGAPTPEALSRIVAGRVRAAMRRLAQPFSPEFMERLNEGGPDEG